MKIITIPHPTLRQVASPIETIDDQVFEFVQNLEKTLTDTSNPPGVGLAGPQVDKLWRVFSTNLPEEGDLGEPGNRPQGKLRHYINPRISKACKRKKVLGVDPKEPDLEGCLSMPGLYGPVPRHRWVKLEFETLDEKGKLHSHQERFDGFAARVIQHELDHLDGILFTDYALENGLPVYRVSKKTQQFVPIEKEVLEAI